MIDVSLALQLRDAGLSWRPAAGDRFMVTNTELVDDVFHLADMVIEARELDTGTIFAFNGTTEWALDSVAQDNTVWLPGESQLRALLGRRFAALAQTADGFVVTLDDGSEHRDHDAENAYAKALLSTIT